MRSLAPAIQLAEVGLQGIQAICIILCLGKLMQILFSLNLPFSFFTFYANFLFFYCVIHYFGLQVHAARLILSLVFVGSPVLICVDIIGIYC